MTAIRRFQRSLALAMLLVSLAAGLMPTLCQAAGAEPHLTCPDCPAPCCDAGHCSCAIASSVVLLPALVTPGAQYFAPGLPAASFVMPLRASLRLGLAPPGPPPEPSSVLNIRFCRFLE